MNEQNKMGTMQEYRLLLLMGALMGALMTLSMLLPALYSTWDALVAARMPGIDSPERKCK